jgi:hypothetical protein
MFCPHLMSVAEFGPVQQSADTSLLQPLQALILVVPSLFDALEFKLNVPLYIRAAA